VREYEDDIVLKEFFVFTLKWGRSFNFFLDSMRYIEVDTAEYSPN